VYLVGANLQCVCMCACVRLGGGVSSLGRFESLRHSVWVRQSLLVNLREILSEYLMFTSCNCHVRLRSH